MLISTLPAIFWHSLRILLALCNLSHSYSQGPEESVTWNPLHNSNQNSTPFLSPQRITLVTIMEITSSSAHTLIYQALPTVLTAPPHQYIFSRPSLPDEHETRPEVIHQSFPVPGVPHSLSRIVPFLALFFLLSQQDHAILKVHSARKQQKHQIKMITS